MYFEHSAFRPPEIEDAKIWRFMEFTKFVSLLDTKSLYFARADKFNDPFEGSYTKLNQQLRSTIYEGVPKHVLKNISATLAQWRRYVAINCWHLNEHESAAMWDLYIKGTEGVAIQSTFRSLTESFSLHADDSMFADEVSYIDYENDWMPEGNLFYAFMHKRKSFEHERELRALLCRYPVQGKDELDFSLIESYCY